MQTCDGSRFLVTCLSPLFPLGNSKHCRWLRSLDEISWSSQKMLFLRRTAPKFATATQDTHRGPPSAGSVHPNHTIPSLFLISHTQQVIREEHLDAQKGHLVTLYNRLFKGSSAIVVSLKPLVIRDLVTASLRNSVQCQPSLDWTLDPRLCPGRSRRGLTKTGKYKRDSIRCSELCQ